MWKKKHKEGNSITIILTPYPDQSLMIQWDLISAMYPFPLLRYRINHINGLDFMADDLNHLSPEVLIFLTYLNSSDFPMCENEQVVIFTLH